MNTVQLQSMILGPLRAWIATPGPPLPVVPSALGVPADWLIVANVAGAADPIPLPVR